MGGQDRLAPFENFVSLKSLTYSGASAKECLFEMPGESFDFSKISNLSRLEEIRILNWHSENFEEVGILPNLRVLHLEETVDQKTFDQICRSTLLQDLRIATVAEDHANIAELRRLESLWLYSSEPIKDLEFIVEMKKLRRLLIPSEVQNYDAIGIHDGLEHVGLLLKSGTKNPKLPTQLKSVYLYGVEGPDLQFLSDCRDLENLVLPKAKVSDYSVLTNLKNLRVLVLDGSNFDQRLRWENLAKLEYLDLKTRMPVSIDGIDQLKNLKFLEAYKIDRFAVIHKKVGNETWENIYACRIPYHCRFGPVVYFSE